MVTLKTLKASEEDFTNQQVTSCSYCPCFTPTVVLLLVSWATNFRGCLSGSSYPILSILHTVTPTLSILTFPFPPCCPWLYCRTVCRTCSLSSNHTEKKLLLVRHSALLMQREVIIQKFTPCGET